MQRILAIIIAGVFFYGTKSNAVQPPGNGVDGGLQLDANTYVEKFVPTKARDESDEDRVHAFALITDARLHFQRDDYVRSLARYQRGYRYSRTKKSIAEEIVPLALHLRRPEEAIRYARLLGKETRVDPFILRRLAAYAAEQLSDMNTAVFLYELAIGADDPNELSSHHVLTRFEMGRLAFLAGDYARAAKSFAIVATALEDPKKYRLEDRDTKALTQQPQVTYGVFAESFLQNQDFDLAEKYFRKSFPTEKQLAILNFNLARIEFRRKNYDAALEKLTAYFDAKNQEAGISAYELYQRILLQTSPDRKAAFEKLIEKLESTLTKNPNDFVAGYFLASAQLENGSIEKSIALNRALLAKRPAPEGFVGLIDAFIKLKKANELLPILSQVAKIPQGLATIQRQLTMIGTDDELAKELVTLAVSKLETSDQSTKLIAGIIAKESKQFDAADKFYRSIVNAKGSTDESKANLIVAWGLDMLLEEETKRAIEIFTQLVNLELPEQVKAEAYFYLSGALAADQKYDQALNAAKVAIRLSPRMAMFRTRPAWIHYIHGKLQLARTEYEEFLDEFGDEYELPSVRASVKEARMSLSNICVAEGKIDEAIEWLELVLDEYPGDIGALNDLGYLWADENVHLNRALKMTQLASSAEPENVAYLDSVGWALYRLGRLSEAIKMLQKASDVENPDGIILDHLGDAYLAAGQKKNALATWEKAISHFDESYEKEKKQTLEKIKQLKESGV